MAERRMFNKKITDSDAFIEMPATTQALYFHLNQGADDDGFNNQIQMAMYKAHAAIDDVKILLMKNFIIRFESGVIVIKHWRMHNTLRKDRYVPTSYQEELKQLNLKDNESYTLSDGCQAVAERLPSGCRSIGKVSIGKDSVESGARTCEDTHPTVEEIAAYCKERQNGIDAKHFYDYYEARGWMLGNTPMKDYKAVIRDWERRNGSPSGSFNADDFFQAAVNKTYTEV